LELIFYVVLAGFLVFLLGSAVRLPSRTVGMDYLKAGGFPTIVIVLALIIIIALTVLHVRQRRKEGKSVFSESKVHTKVLEVAGLVAGYLVLMNIIGFTLATLVFTFVNPLVMGYKKYKLLAIYSVVLTVLIVAVFGKFFGVPLPRGPGILRELSFRLY